MIAVSNNRCCAGCKHWQMGPYWGSGPRGIECKGTCHAKKNVRNRWNYYPASKCKLYQERDRIAKIAMGNEVPTFEQLKQIIQL